MEVSTHCKSVCCKYSLLSYHAVVALITLASLYHESDAFLVPGPSTGMNGLSKYPLRKGDQSMPTAFLGVPSSSHYYSYITVSNTNMALHATKEDTTPPLPNSSDPFIILNLKPTADQREIKRAYKRMALKYHPDVRTNTSSTDAERKEANDDFARINAAYAFLTGKSDDRPTDANGNAGSSTSRGRAGAGAGTGGGYGYTPPHRRTGAERKSYEASDWKDYMPKYDDYDTKYDAGGDSFGAIFSDLFAEMASGSGSAGGGGILNDLISFLEGNFPSVGTNPAQRTEEDIILESLLRDGSIEEIKNELDDAKLLVRQLESKEIDLDVELKTIVKEKEEKIGKSYSYMEDMSLEERRREVEARKSVVGEYLERARMRQIKLRKRYEELRTSDSGTAGARAGGGYRSGYSSSYSRDTGSASDRTSSSGSTGYGAAGGSSSRPTGSGTGTDDDAAWKRESFGSSRRRRGGSGASSRRRSRPDENTTRESSSSSSSRQRTTASSPYSSASSSSNYSSGYSSTRSSSANRQASSAANQSRAGYGGLSGDIPPHRRVTTTNESRYQQIQEDKRRIRDIKVDEEIDKMKKELGL